MMTVNLSQLIFITSKININISQNELNNLDVWIMLIKILEHMAQPRYFLGTLYLAWAGVVGGNLLLEAITVGICCGVIDLYKERPMK
tara:strand:+ start:264 stop:524 length:261 start_codon:yes stop_codon:yes gene_type:complete